MLKSMDLNNKCKKQGRVPGHWYGVLLILALGLSSAEPVLHARNAQAPVEASSGSSDNRVLQDPSVKVRPSEDNLLKKSSESFRYVARLVSPSVVTIKASVSPKPAVRMRRGFRLPGPFGGGPQDPNGGQGLPFPNDPLFDFFRHFGQPFGGGPTPPAQPQTSLGSGVIIRKDGYIVTNNHVVENADKIVVNLQNSEKDDLAAEVVGRDPRSDLAVIKLKVKKQVQPAEWADSDAIEQGDWAIAIGSPFMLSGTLTVGIVSAKGRNSSTLLRSDYSYDMIQTDAAINPGNSGGPLCTIDGKVMGINTAIYTRTMGYMGIGFAIPSNIAKHVTESLITKGKVIRGWLGVTIQDVNPKMAQELALPGGALVNEAEPESPAAKAGFKAGDVITKIGDKVVLDASQAKNQVSNLSPGARIAVEVVNYGDKKKVIRHVVIGELPENKSGGPGSESSDKSSGGKPDRLGLMVKGDPNGVRIVGVEPGSIAEQLQLQKDDVVISINRQRVRSEKEYENVLKAAKDLNLIIRRGNQEMFFSLTLPD